MSANRGEQIVFKINTPSTAYRVDIFRLGWYGGLGARKIGSVSPSVPLPQVQPPCLTDSTGLYDCGNWAPSAFWTVPESAVSGVYLAVPVRTDGPGASQIPFVVRDDASKSAIVVQTADTTWQALNSYGGKSFYTTQGGVASKVSYNRPFDNRGAGFAGRDFFSLEYPLVRFLERNGYDISYISGVDTHARGSLLRSHKVFVSMGQDAYWTSEQRANVEAARDSGVGLAFFGGSTALWKARFDESISGGGQPNRSLVSYRETLAGKKQDPSTVWTGTWRDRRFSPPSDGGRPENSLTGTMFQADCCVSQALTVSSEEAKLRLWRGTALATLRPGTSAAVGNGTLGFAVDEDVDNGFRPAGLVRFSSTSLPTDRRLTDAGATYAPGKVTHAVTMYRAPSGARVFSTGALQWAWGLDEVHDGVKVPTDAVIQQATLNVLADMGAQPASIQADLQRPEATTDTSAPRSTIASPANATRVRSGASVSISGTATDSNGLVAGVEVSTDDGKTWHPATGRGTWTYSWSGAGLGTTKIRSRATDDSGNVELPTPGVSVVSACPCSFFSSDSGPNGPSPADPAAVDVGVRFRSDAAGFVSAIRFFKDVKAGAAHTVTLWSADGTALAQAVSANETASGWQEVRLPKPVRITPNTVYVASYFSPTGGYASTKGFFTDGSLDVPPLHAPRNGPDSANGVFAYASTPSFPNRSGAGLNYWVDVVFATDGTAPPAVPASGATKTAKTTKTKTSKAAKAGTTTPTSAAPGVPRTTKPR